MSYISASDDYFVKGVYKARISAIRQKAVEGSGYLDSRSCRSGSCGLAHRRYAVQAKSYSKLISVQDGDFAEDVAEIDFQAFPCLTAPRQTK